MNHNDKVFLKFISISSIFTISLLCLIVSCSSTIKRSVVPKQAFIQSSPSGASVFNTSGEKLGTTPLKLVEQELGKIITDESYSFIVKYPGHVEREVAVDAAHIANFELKLTPNNKERFEEVVLNSYASEVNTMVRSLLMVQGLIFLKKYDQAATKLQELQPKYPSVAAIYTLLGNIYLNTGRTQEAREQFSRAVSLDPADTSAKRFLNQQN